MSVRDHSWWVRVPSAPVVAIRRPVTPPLPATWQVPALGSDGAPPPAPTAPPAARRRRAGRGAVGSEHGDRGRFLATARARLGGGIPTDPVHPPPSLHPPPPLPDVAVPVREPIYANLDAGDLVGTFTRAVEDVGGICHRVVGAVPDALLDHLVAELDAWEVVVSADPQATALGERLAGRGVVVGPATPDAAARAAVGVTSAVAGIAVTGAVVLDSRWSGGRVASLLPAVHLCVLPAERLVATPGDVLRPLGADTAALPPTMVLETGPPRTGDIEQILTFGAHGPTRLHIILVS